MRQSSFANEVAIPIGDLHLVGDLSIPLQATGLVLFAHGSGSSRFSWRNRSVARHLNDNGLATLLFDLLTDEEEGVDRVTTSLRFNMDLLASRLVSAVDWIAKIDMCRDLAIGCFGASTGGGAALMAAARRINLVHAVVSRGGRPDLVDTTELKMVRAPTLFIVGEQDQDVLTLNHQAMAAMHAPVQLEIVTGASHLFVEPGALDHVADLASAWFQQHLPTTAERSR